MKDLVTVKVHVLVLLLFLISACNKIDVPEPKEEEPVFQSHLKLGDRSLNLAAGQNNYELVTRFNKTEQVMTFMGIFKPKDCPSLKCAQSLRFLIRDVKPYDRTTFNADESIRPRTHPFGWLHHRDSVKVQFLADSSFRQGYKIEWQILDQMSSQDHAATQVILDRSKHYKIGVRAVRGVFESSQVQTVDLANGGCQAFIQVRDRDKLAVVAKGKEPFRYQWSHHDDTSRIVSTSISSNEHREYRVTVTDARGYQSVASVNNQILRLTNADVVPSSINFRIASREHLSNRDPMGFRNVIVEYFDRDLQSFSSLKFSQPAQANFKILAVSDFNDNPEGQKTKKIEARLSCHLFGSNVNDFIPLEGRVVFAVAYPD